MIRFSLMASLFAALPLTATAQGTPGAHFITNWDLDENGVVTLDELTSRRGDVFVMFDDDENGALDAAEYTAFDDTRAADMANNAGEGHGKGGARMQEGMTLSFNDTNGDGTVSMDEFVGHSADWLNMIDRNGDGGVSPADFGPQTN